MKRTTISLPEELALLAERAAAQRGVSVSEVTRQALTDYLGLAGTTPRDLPFANLGSSGHRHGARDLEEILAAEWARDAARDRWRRATVRRGGCVRRRP